MSPPPKVPAASDVPAHPPRFRLRVRLFSPLDLEKERAGTLIASQFIRKEYRILWGTESVPGVTVPVPRAYHGMVDPEDGTVSEDVVDVPTGGYSRIELGEYQDKPPSGLDAGLLAVDQRAPRQHFHPLVTIPLVRFDPRPVPKDAMQEELWWRLWNLGLLGNLQAPATSNRIAKPQWNLVRARLERSAPPDSDDALMTDLLRHHDHQR